jgi:recombination protein U
MSYANRGKVLESNILTANRYYDQWEKAVIIQAPTPVHIQKVIKNRVTGFLKGKATVDFYGTFKGQALYFDAKETTRPSWPLDNLEAEQIVYLDKQAKQQAICFIVLGFVKEREEYVLPWKVIKEYQANMAAGGRKSIPLADCRERDDIFKVSTAQGFLDYLEPVIIGSLE